MTAADLERAGTTLWDSVVGIASKGGYGQGRRPGLMVGRKWLSQFWYCHIPPATHRNP